MKTGQPFASRRAGILLHPSSLPGSRDSGDLGADAYRFVDSLAAAGQTVWQALPLGPTHDGGSPYQCLSVHAGNARLISLDRFVEAGWISPGDLQAAIAAGEVLTYAEDGVWSCALRGFCARADESLRAEYGAFLRGQQEWLAEYALFVALRAEFGRAAWTEWPAPLRDRDPAALLAARERHGAVIERVCFEQFQFHRQWHGIRRYANERGVLLFGDMPIFVAHDSVDVWVDRHLFNLDGDGRCAVVAGVPPVISPSPVSAGATPLSLGWMAQDFIAGGCGVWKAIWRCSTWCASIIPRFPSRSGGRRTAPVDHGRWVQGPQGVVRCARRAFPARCRWWPRISA